MKVLHVVSTLGVGAAGPGIAAINMARAAREFGVEPMLLTTNYLGEPVLTPDFPLRVCAAHGRWAYAATLRKELRAWLGDADVCHIHGVWQYPPMLAASTARALGVPYVITPHGMLQSYFHRGYARRLRHTLMMWMGQAQALRSAAGLHFLTQAEYENTFWQLNGRHWITPNTITTVALQSRLEPHPHLLSLSILQPRKNVDGLIQAMPSILRRLPAARLRIAGQGCDSYVRYLIALARQADPSGQIIQFVGRVAGQTKADLLGWASLFCLLSHQDTHAMGTLEAMAAGLPILISPGVNQNDVAAAGAGLVVDGSPERIADGVARILGNREVYRAFSRSALIHVQAHYSARATGEIWSRRYADLCGTAAAATLTTPPADRTSSSHA